VSRVDRFTTVYDAREDRIRLLIKLTSGDVQELLLTRRLMGKLVQALLKRLETAVSVNHGSVSASSKGAFQRFNQAAAVDRLRKQKSGSTSLRKEKKKDAAVLVTKVGLRWSRRLIALDLKDDEEVRQTLSFNEETLRQWMAVVHSQYKIAKWSDELWPSWVQSRTDRASIARPN